MAFFDWLIRLFQPKAVCSAKPGTDALMAVIRLTVAAGRNTVAFLATGALPVGAVLAYGSLLPDVVKVLTEYQDIPCELSALTPAGYATLLETVVAEFGFADDHAKAVIESAVSLVADVTGLAPKVKHLLASVHTFQKPLAVPA